MPESPALLVLSNLPDQASAEKLADLLIEGRLAACVNILAPCISVYRWQGKTERASEVPLLIKTTGRAYPAVEETIRANHPYELPEIVQVPITGGLPAYIQWLTGETKI
ncbi:MAG TPA: divalent-cation tolerance protein CutA [Methylophilaceae bacterium]|nr:divalent-cation tolerance protein CutA [Methylophilaceae bacterium]